MIVTINLRVWYNAGMPNLGPYKTKWDLSLISNTNKDYNINENLDHIAKENYGFIDKWKDRSDYLVDPVILKEALDDYEHLEATCGTSGEVGTYYWLKQSLDQNDVDIKAKLNKLNEISTKVANGIEFFIYKLSKVDVETQKKFLESSVLQDYRHFLELLFSSAKYLLTEKEEKLLNLLSKSSYSNWIDMVSEFLSKEEVECKTVGGGTKTVAFGELFSLMKSPEKSVRDGAASKFNEILKKYADTAEHEINSILENKQVQDDLRGIDRPDFLRHLEDDIDSETVDTLLNAVESRFDISKRYFELKAKLFGVDKLAYHERDMEYGPISKKYSFEEAINLVAEVYGKLDPEFKKILLNFVKVGRIDAFPKKGKIYGNFFVDFLITQPSYVLLNFTENLDAVISLAHEMGHAINKELMKVKENALNFESPECLGEVASTFFEDFVLEKLAEDTTDEMKLSLMMARLDYAISSIHSQVACYRFEQELHTTFKEKGYLSKDEISAIFEKHMKAYIGDFVEQSDGSENWWVCWEHIRTFFYVYSYASGLLVSKALQKMVREDPTYIKKIKQFFSVGTSKSPKEIFADLGIDISKKAFWDQGLAEIDSLLNETYDLAKKLGKI